MNMTPEEWEAEVDKRADFNEGDKRHIYKDSKGIPSIGVGFNMTREDALEICQSVGADYYGLLAGREDLTAEQDAHIFAICMEPCQADLRKLINNYDKLSDARRAALTDMWFNMGEGGLASFTTTLGIIEDGINAGSSALAHNKFTTAAQHIRASQYAKDVGDRALRNAAMIETSNWVPYNQTY